ncbi:MAG TPA: acyl-CoA dehydrogenase family protein [Parachlamydiaceae bacterium]|nr:acyl-CoA dehydrogenase family protein [Parachlamydiaceae bacterium]
MDEQQKRLAEELLFSGRKSDSFAKAFYFGIFDSSKVFPFPKPPSEEKVQVEELLKNLKHFINEKIDPVAIDKNACIPNEVLKGLGKLGILGMTIPKEYGGLGLSQYAYCKAEELLASHCASTALFVNAHQSVGLKAILLFGTEEQKKKWLLPLAKGEMYAAFSLTEPNAGSDAAGIETRAVFDPEKNVYRITGKKQWTTNGSIAGVLTVMAKTKVQDQDKITAFLVTPDMPGFKVLDSSLEKVGMRGTWTSNLEFQDMEVPVSHILGPFGGGLKVCLTVLDYGRTTFGATCTGSAAFALEKAIYHAKTRYQFKRPLASFALVKKKIAMMAALKYAMEATTYLTASFVDRKAEDFMLESAILKVFASDSLWKILYETMQIYGGRSFFKTAPFERMMRDARLNMIGEGANEVMRVFIGLVGIRDVGMHLKEVLEAFKNPFLKPKVLGRFILAMIKRLKAPLIAPVSPHLKKEALNLGSAMRRFGFSVIKVLGNYGEGIFEKQLELNRIAEGAIAIYTASAVLSKLSADLKEVNENTLLLKNDVNTGKFYISYALDQLNHHLDSLLDPRDEKIEALSDEICGL